MLLKPRGFIICLSSLKMTSKTEIFRIQYLSGSMVGLAAPPFLELSRKTDHFSSMLTDKNCLKITSIAGQKGLICYILSSHLVLDFQLQVRHKITIIVISLNR